MGMQNLPRRSRAILLSVATLALSAASCIYDSSDRCGPAMSFVAAVNACVCDSNAIAVLGGCQPCAADEVAVGGKCGCPQGQTKNASGTCAVVAGLGDPCDTSAACTDHTYSYCAHTSSGGPGSCTKSCATDNDCDSAYTCATWEAQPYCRTFEGVGASCSTSADCHGDANFCDTFQTHTCGVSGCSLTDSDCPRGTMCCDFSAYGLGTLCAGACQ